MTGTNLLLTEISKYVEGFKRKEAAVQQYKYSKVRSEYLWECLFCAEEGHEEDTCATKNKSSKSSKNNKRDNGHLSSPEKQPGKERSKNQKMIFFSFFFLFSFLLTFQGRQKQFWSGATSPRNKILAGG